MDIQWLITVLVEIGLGVSAYRLANKIQLKQAQTDVKVANHETRLVKLEAA